MSEQSPPIPDALQAFLSSCPHLKARLVPHALYEKWELFCTGCLEKVAVQGLVHEVAPLSFESGVFSVGKPEAVDGESTVTCGCGIDYPIEWQTNF